MGGKRPNLRQGAEVMNRKARHSGRTFTKRKRRAATYFGVVAAVGLVAAACGNSPKPKQASSTNSTLSNETTSTTVAASTSTTMTGTQATPTTLVTTTTSKPATTSTAKSSSKSAAKQVTVGANTKAASPIANVAATSTTVTTEPIQPGGNINYAVVSELATLDPANAPSGLSALDQSGTRLAAIYDQLVYENADGTLVPQTAQSVTSSDGTVWTLKLNPTIKFSDGTPYDANAVKYNWNRQLDPTLASSAFSTMKEVKALDVLDATTLKITLTGVDGQFPRGIATYLAAIGSPAAIQSEGSNWFTAPVGAGPFLVKEWVRNDHLTLLRNPGYWRSPQPYLDQVTFKVIPDNDQRMNTFLAGDADVLGTTGVASAANGIAAKRPYIDDINNGSRVFVFNLTRPPFNDVRLRQAVSLAIDWDAYNGAIEGGAGAKVTDIFQPGSPFYDPSLTTPTKNAAQAQTLFDAVAKDNGGPVSFTVACSTTNASTCEFVQGQLLQYKNIRVSTESLVGNQVSPRIFARNFDMILTASVWRDPDPTMYNQFRSDSPTNFSGIANTDMDKALISGHTSLDPAVRAGAYKTVQQILLQQLPFIWFYRLQSFQFFQPKIQDVQVFSDGSTFVSRMWIKR
jgi:peptide/nickel transport system substrate-binding protein